MGSSVIRLENVWKIYDLGKIKVKALKGVSIRIKKGEFLAIMGPSGSGKSTFLHIAGCLDKPTEGKVFIKNRRVDCLDENELADIRLNFIGFVFQFFYLLPTLSALENVELPTIFKNIPRKERIKKARELLEKVGLKGRESHKPMELSGGERQRVAIARALANDPEVVLADEPTGNLDTKSGKIIMDLFKRLNKEGKTVVVVTHDPQIANYADRIAVMRDGKIIKDNVNINEAMEIIRGE